MFGLHAGMAILGYSAFAVSAIYGFLFLLLYHDLKSTHFGLIYRRLPSLDVLAKMNIRAAVLGLAVPDGRDRRGDRLGDPAATRASCAIRCSC